MPKHVIEDDRAQRTGFNKIKIGDNVIASGNTERYLEFYGDGTVDIDIIENKIRLISRIPKFTTRDF